MKKPSIFYKKAEIQIIYFIITFIFVLTNYIQSQTIEIRDDFKKYYDQFDTEGTFILFDQNNDRLISYNQSLLNKPFIPASTFKILNSLIGLETGIIENENFVLTWDSVVRQVPGWNKDQDLKTAFKNSTVWYYQELARRVGGLQMKYWLDKVNYGNADTSGGIDKFWLSGGLRITPQQQIDLLKKLRNNMLPFSQRSMDIVKNIMITEEKTDYIIRGKSGWSSQDDKDIGWYVGYLETTYNVYYFANCIQTADLNNNNFGKARKEIVYQILKELKLITE